MKRILTTLAQKWPEYLLEILVLIIGIYGAFALDNWNENIERRKKESILLKELNKEFISNKQQFEFILKKHENLYHASSKIADMFPIDPVHANLDTISKYLGQMEWGYTFDPSQGVVNSIISTSSFDLISNDSLRAALITWSDTFADYTEEERDAKQLENQNLLLFWNKHLPFYGQLSHKQFDRSILTTIEFENTIYSLKGAMEGILKNQQNEMDKVRKLIDKIIELSDTKRK